MSDEDIILPSRDRKHSFAVAYVVNNAAFFVSHRLPVAQAAHRAGMSVCLVTGQQGSREMEKKAELEVAAAGIPHIRVGFTPAGTNPILEAISIVNLALVLRRQKPSLVHCASPKGVLYGGIAARLAGIPALVLAVTGLGYAHTASTSASFSRRISGLAFNALAKVAFGHRRVRVIVQNPTDHRFLIDKNLVNAKNVSLIPGSGVPLHRFPAGCNQQKENIVLFPARMLRDKGLVEFVTAAMKIRLTNSTWRFVLAGAADCDNPSSVSTAEVDRWCSAGSVEWLGHVEDMVPWYQKASIVCLPSYREGMPKALLEAAAAGCAVVTTDTPGCRDAINPGITGDLVPPRDSEALASALLKLMDDATRRRAYGEAGRRLAESKFSLESVVSQTLNIYTDLIS